MNLAELISLCTLCKMSWNDRLFCTVHATRLYSVC